VGSHLYRFDPVHSSVELAVRHMLVSKVRGRLNRWSGWLVFDPARPEGSRGEVVVEAGSIDTGHAARDEDLRSARFLDVARFPTIDFRSLAIDRLADSRFRMGGEVTMHGVTRPLALEVEWMGQMVAGNVERVGFRAAGALCRKEFGMSFNHLLDCGGVAFGERIELELDVVAIRELGCS
jgi:polyisoprenoid-binding protein YceI